MLCDPTARIEVVNVKVAAGGAALVLTAVLPIRILLSKKETEPVGVLAGIVVSDTVAVNVAVAPRAAGFVGSVSTVVVVSGTAQALPAAKSTARNVKRRRRGATTDRKDRDMNSP